jgi:hypothetical protein
MNNSVEARHIDPVQDPRAAIDFMGRVFFEDDDAATVEQRVFNTSVTVKEYLTNPIRL